MNTGFLNKKVLQTFLHLQLHSVEGPVSKAGSRAMANRNSKVEKQKRRIEVMKMTKKQRKVSVDSRRQRRTCMGSWVCDSTCVPSSKFVVE